MIRQFLSLSILFLLSSFALGQSESDVRDLIEDLFNSSGVETLRLRRELLELGEPAIQPLLDIAASADVRRASRAWLFLGQMGVKLKPYQPQIIALLDNDNGWLRSGALRALENSGPIPPDAVPILAEQLNQLGNYMDKLAVAETLGNVGEAAVPALINLLQQGDPLTREYATRALGWNGPAARSATSALTDSLHVPGKDVESLFLSVDALRKVGGLPHALPVFLDMLATGSIESRIMAATVLGQWDYSYVDQIVPVLVEALSNDDSQLRVATVRSLAHFSPHSRVALPDLIPLLNEPYAPLREATAEAIRDFGPYLDTVIPAAIAALGDESDPVRSSAADILANQRADPGLAGSALTRAALESSWQVQLRAREALKAIDPSGEAVAPIVLDALSSNDEVHRRNALQLLAEMGHVDPAVENEVLRLLGDPSPDVRSSAAYAMLVLEIRLPRAIPVLVDLLEDESPAVRISATRTLSLYGAESGAAVPALIGMLSTEDPERHEIVIETLGAIGPPAAESVRALLDLLRSANPIVAAEIIDSLLSIGPQAFSAVRRLVDSDLANWSDQTDPTAPVDLYHAKLLLQSGYTTDRLVELFERALAHTNPSLAANAVTALEMLAPQSATAIPALLQLSVSRETNQRTRSEARDAAAFISASQTATSSFPGRVSIDASTLPELIERLDSPRAEDRAAAVQSLGMLGQAAESAVPDLIRALSDRSGIVRHYAALSLSVSMIGPRGREAFEPLVAATQDFDINVRNAARLSLSVSGLDPFGFAPQDIWFQPGDARRRAFTLQDPRDEYTVAWMVGVAEFLGPASVDLLLQAVRGGRGFNGVTAIRTLGLLDFDDPRISETLIDTARTQTGSLQTESIVALGLLASDAQEALPFLDDFKYHRLREVRLAAKTSADLIRSE